MCGVNSIKQHEKIPSCKNVRGGCRPTSDKGNGNTSIQSVDVINTEKCVNEMVEVKKSPTTESNNANELDRHIDDALSAKVISTEDKDFNYKCKPKRHDDVRDSMNEANGKNLEFTPIFDINYTGIEDKFANSILHVHQFTKNSISNVNTTIHKKKTAGSVPI